MPGVLVYRHQLFVRSEPFILDQAAGCGRWGAVMCGRRCVGPSPPGMPVVAFSSGRLADAWHTATAAPGRIVAALAAAGVRPQLVHAHFGVEGVYALEVARRLRVPLVVTFHGFDATTSRWGLLSSGHPAWWRYLATRRRLDRPDVTIICVSEFIRRRVEAFGWTRARLETHRIGIDTGRIVPGPPGDRPPVLVHVARLVEKKGTIHLLRAFARCRQAHPGASLVILGDGPLRRQLEAAASALGLGDAVRFTGAVSRDEVLAAVGGARALCVPSITARNGDSEGLPIVVLEAMAAGVAVVATRHAGLPEAVSDGDSGLLVGERDEPALAEAIGRLLGDPALAGRLGAAGRTRVCAGFDLQHQNRLLEGIYDAALARGGAG